MCLQLQLSHKWQIFTRLLGHYIVQVWLRSGPDAGNHTGRHKMERPHPPTSTSRLSQRVHLWCQTMMTAQTCRWLPNNAVCVPPCFSELKCWQMFLRFADHLFSWIEKVCWCGRMLTGLLNALPSTIITLSNSLPAMHQWSHRGGFRRIPTMRTSCTGYVLLLQILQCLALDGKVSQPLI